MSVYQLDDDLWFPDPHHGEEGGLIAVGGDLSPDRLLLAYSNGFFPWYSFRHESQPSWYCPMDRFVIIPKEIHISHTMRQMMAQNKYSVTFNEDFDAVIRGCAEVNGRCHDGGAWLGPDMIEAYTKLHDMGYAVSVEVWESMDATAGSTSESPRGKLVGGLYGVSFNNIFFGESMFSLVPSASKLALIRLAQALDMIGGPLIDCQFETPHLKSMGGRYMSYETYMEIIRSQQQIEHNKE